MCYCSIVLLELAPVSDHQDLKGVQVYFKVAIAVWVLTIALVDRVQDFRVCCTTVNS